MINAKEVTMNKKSLYQIIEADLMGKIQSGEYPEGSIIPKETELATKYGVSRPTIRQAIQNLANQGYLQRKKRLGTVVISPKIDQEFTQIIESFNHEMQRKGKSYKTVVVTFKKDVAGENVAKQLKLKATDDVYKLIRLRYADERPIVLVTTYIPYTLIPNLNQYDFALESLYDVLGKERYPVLRIRRTLDVILADETSSDLLDIGVGSPLFYFHSLGYSVDQTPVEYSISKYRGDINTFVFEIDNRH